jgi:hypothetical protein
MEARLIRLLAVSAAIATLLAVSGARAALGAPHSPCRAVIETSIR